MEAIKVVGLPGHRALSSARRARPPDAVTYCVGRSLKRLVTSGGNFLRSLESRVWLEELGQYEFGGFRLDCGRRLLMTHDGGETVKLTSKGFETLLCLVEHRGKTLEKSSCCAPSGPIRSSTRTISIKGFGAAPVLRREAGRKPLHHDSTLDVGSSSSLTCEQ